jgi:hypothetical protein
MDENSDPATLVRNHKRLKNSSQNIPRASEELKQNSEQWVKLQEAFASVFEWIRAMVIFPPLKTPLFSKPYVILAKGSSS